MQIESDLMQTYISMQILNANLYLYTNYQGETYEVTNIMISNTHRLWHNCTNNKYTIARLPVLKYCLLLGERSV